MTDDETTDGRGFPSDTDSDEDGSGGRSGDTEAVGATDRHTRRRVLALGGAAGAAALAGCSAERTNDDEGAGDGAGSDGE
ncbi:thiamine ABC transporter substrate-binding protein, partial [Halorubrum sp. SD626R]